jgi:hypothetical protein
MNEKVLKNKRHEKLKSHTPKSVTEKKKCNEVTIFENIKKIKLRDKVWS